MRIFGVMGLLFLGSVSPLQAHISTGSISGSVTNTQGERLPNAVVQLIAQRKCLTQTLIPNAMLEEKHLVLNALTDSTGEFTFPNIPEGTYTLRVFAPTYKGIERNIELKSNQSLILSPQLETDTNRAYVPQSTEEWRKEQAKDDPNLAHQWVQALIRKYPVSIKQRQTEGVPTFIVSPI